MHATENHLPADNPKGSGSHAFRNPAALHRGRPGHPHHRFFQRMQPGLRPGATIRKACRPGPQLHWIGQPLHRLRHLLLGMPGKCSGAQRRRCCHRPRPLYLMRCVRRGMPLDGHGNHRHPVVPRCPGSRSPQGSGVFCQLEWRCHGRGRGTRFAGAVPVRLSSGA